jgi:heterodisulfide reductase subunit C
MPTPNKSPLIIKGGREARDFLAKVDAMAATQVEACYQCGKCSGGCPLSFAMDYQPRQIMRLVQLGLVDEALVSSTIWVCATCFTCTARCPREIDIAGVMDALRVLATRKGVRPGDRNIGVFHRAFLNSIRRFGRGYELGLMLLYKLGTLRLTEDMGLGIKMFAKGKLAVLPERTKGRKEIAAIFRESAEGGGKEGTTR